MNACMCSYGSVSMGMLVDVSFMCIYIVFMCICVDLCFCENVNAHVCL